MKAPAVVVATGLGGGASAASAASAADIAAALGDAVSAVAEAPTYAVFAQAKASDGFARGALRPEAMRFRGESRDPVRICI